MTSYLVIGISERIAYDEYIRHRHFWSSFRMTYKLFIGIPGRVTKNRSGSERVKKRDTLLPFLNFSMWRKEFGRLARKFNSYENVYSPIKVISIIFQLKIQYFVHVFLSISLVGSYFLRETYARSIASYQFLLHIPSFWSAHFI